MDKVVDENKRDELTQAIKKKFGSVAKFIDLAGLDYWIFYEQLKGRRRMTHEQWTKYLALVRKVNNRPRQGVDLTIAQRTKIREAILAHPGAEKDGEDPALLYFCENEGYEAAWIGRLLTNKHYQIKRLTPKIKKLAQLLNIKL